MHVIFGEEQIAMTLGRDEMGSQRNRRQTETKPMLSICIIDFIPREITYNIVCPFWRFVFQAKKGSSEKGASCACLSSCSLLTGTAYIELPPAVKTCSPLRRNHFKELSIKDISRGNHQKMCVSENALVECLCACD